jgi:hypothetical protein
VQRVIVTNRRMIRISGVLTRKVGSIPLKRMTDLTFHRGLWGRVLGYGDLVVESAGQEAGRYRLDHLPRPNDFYRVLSRRVAPATTVPVPDPVVPEDQQDTGPLPRVIV